MKTARQLALVAAVLVAACEKKTNPSAQAAGDSGAVPSMQGTMGGMGMKGMGMMPMMGAHLDSMAGMSSQQMAAMMAAHQNLMSRMLDAMGADMRSMSMTANTEWTALADSIRTDLAELPGLSGPAMAARMQAHIDRMRRLMARHQAMMKM